MTGPRGVAGRRALAGALLAAVMAATASCGVPTGGAPSAIAPSDVPYGLASPSPTAPAATLAEPVADAPAVFLIAADDSLVPQSRKVTGASPAARLGHLLERLAEGPTGEERDHQLSTALPPDVELTVSEVSDGTATVDIGGIVDSPSGWATRRAVGQLVLTATTVQGIDAVRLTLSGEPVEAPLPDGELTSDALTADDYQAFLTPPPPPTTEPAAPSAVPAPGSTPTSAPPS